jgi:hypothetical protein
MKEDIEQLRKLIRELNLEWLDEEIEEILTTGKLQQKEIFEGQKRKNRGIEQVSFSEKEQLEIIISAIKNYFVTLPLVQTDIENTLFETLKIDKVRFYEDNEFEFKNVSKDTQKLSGLLNEVLK